MALTITKPNPNAKLMAMIRNLHKQGLLDSPSYRQTLKDEAEKLRISDEELERLIVEVKAPMFRLKEMIRKFHKEGSLDKPSNRQKLKDEASKSSMSDDELERLIAEVKDQMFRLKEMIRKFHKEGSLDKPSNQQTLKDEASKSGMSDDELKSLIAEVKGEQQGDYSGGTTEGGGTITGGDGENVKNDNDRKYTPYIIGAAIIIAVACLLFWQPWKNGPVEPPPPHPCDTVVKIKNIARAKANYVNLLRQKPDDSVNIKECIDKCDEILETAKYSTLSAKRGTSPNGEQNKLGFEDERGYIVIDFLYDEEIGRHSEIIALKNKGKCGVVGGTLKDGVSEFKYMEVFWISGNRSYYRLVKNNSGDADEAKVKDGKLIINEHIID